MANVRLLTIDLDGTLIGRVDEFHLYNAFRDKIHGFQRRNNAVWAVCTGRSLRSFESYFAPMQMMGIMPNYVIIKHAFIYKLRRFGYIPHVLWNMRTRYLLLATQLNIRHAIDEWEDMIRQFTLRARIITRRPDRLWISFDTEETTNAVADLLKDRVAAHKNLRMFKYLKEIDIRTVPFTKGLAVSELARHIGVGRDEILAIGDGYNDISMLDGNVARYTGCPANAMPEVMAIVSKQSGHVAREPSLGGVIEVLGSHESDTVRSDLPPEWRDPALGNNPESDRAGKSHEQSRKKRMTSVVLLLAAYACLATFANYHLIPYFSKVIMLPYHALFYVVEKFAWLF